MHWTDTWDRERRHEILSAGQKAAKARLEEAWTFFVRGVKRQLKLVRPKAPPSEWLRSKRTSLPQACGLSQAHLMEKFGIGSTTVRRMRGTLVVLLEIAEGLTNAKGEPRPSPPREVFKRYAKWAAAEKKARETIKRQRTERQREEDARRENWPEFGMVALKKERGKKRAPNEEAGGNTQLIEEASRKTLLNEDSSSSLPIPQPDAGA